MPLPLVELEQPVDAYGAIAKPASCLDVEQPGVAKFAKWVMAHLGGSSAGIKRACTGLPTSDHNEGRAWDWVADANNPSDVARVEELLAWLLAADAAGNPHANFRRAGLVYIVWNKQSIYPSKGGSWGSYGGPSPHTDHVHFSFGWPGALAQTSLYPWIDAGPKPPAPPVAPRHWLAVPLTLAAATAVGYLVVREVKRNPRFGLWILHPSHRYPAHRHRWSSRHW